MTIHAKGDGGLNEGNSSGGGEKCSDSGYILGVDSMGFADRLDMGYEKKEKSQEEL